MNKTASKANDRAVRHKRIRARVVGTAERPRLAVYRSNKFLYAQLINDESGTTLLAADSRAHKDGTPTEQAKALGSDIAKKAKNAGIEKAVFDRGGFRYQGTIAALAESAREGGLVF